jgi:hypothetical protein
MPTFDTPNSTGTYDPPDALDEFKVIVVGGEGGDGNGSVGGDAGKVELVFAPASGETFTYFVGENGDGDIPEDGNDDIPKGGKSPLADGGDGSGSEGQFGTFWGGGGGAVSALRRDSDSAFIGIGEGGGGGGGQTGSVSVDNNYSGGGGSRGGQAGSSRAEDAEGTGEGGDGAFGTVTSEPQPGEDGGTTAIGTATSVTETTVDAPTPRVEIIDHPRNVTLSVTGHTDTSVDLSLDADNAESWTLHRSTTSGFTPDAGNQITSFASGGAQTYSDTGLTQGTTYHYVAVATNPAGDTASAERTQTTDAPAPTFDTLTVVDDNGDGNADELQCDWTDNGTDETAYRVLLSTDGGSSYTNDSGDLAANTTTYTTAEKLDGEQYTVKIRAVYPDTTSDSGTKTATTELPDTTVDSITPIDASVEDELTVPNATVADYGDVRYQIRVTGSGNAYGNDKVVTQGGNPVMFVNLEDGEKYDIRARSETEHKTGDWAEVTAITLMPTPTGIGTLNVSPTSWDVEWDDVWDNEDGVRVYRRREYDGGFGPEKEIADKAPNVTSHTDDGVVQQTTYQYRVEGYTEHVVASATYTDTTPAIDGSYRSNRVSGSGWTVEVETPSGTPRRPQIVGEPKREPSVNDMEKVEIPVPKDETWEDDAFKDAPVKVWKNGERLPIDTLVGRQQKAGKTILVCEGGTELYAPGKYEFSNTDAHAAFGDVVADTPYTADVISPGGGSFQLANVDSEGEMRDYYQQPGDSTPIAIRDDGRLEVQQTCWVYEGENYGNTSTSSYANGDYAEFDDFSGTLAEDVVPDAAEISQTFTTEREIPSSEVGVELRRADHNLNGEFQVFIDGQKVYAELNANEDNVSTRWVNSLGGTSYENDQTGQQVPDPPTLEPGEHVIQIRNIDVSPGGQSEPSSGIAAVDLFCVYDKRYPPNFPNSTESGSDWLSGPEKFPLSVDAILLHKGFLSSTGGRFEGNFSSTTNNQAVAISPDYGSTYTTNQNSSTVEADWPNNPSPDIQLKVTLGGTDGGNTPLKGANTQSLNSYTLYEDTRASPPLTNDQFSGSREDILTALTERGDMIWTLEWDDVNDEIVVRMANVGDLTTDQSLGVVDYEWSRRTLGRQFKRAIIKGGSQIVRGETVTADLLNNNDLRRENLITGREQVQGVSNGVIYERGTDYEMNYVIGEIVFDNNSDTNISDGEELEITYEWKPEGDYNTGGATARKTLRKTFVQASTDVICQSIGFFLVDRLKDPIESGRLVIEDLPADLSVLEAIQTTQIPDRERWVTRTINVQNGTVVMEISTRQTLDGIIEDVNKRVENTAERV